MIFEKCSIFDQTLFNKYYDITGVSNEIVKSINVTPDSYVIFGYVNHGQPDTKLFSIKADTNGVFQKANLYSHPNGNFLTLYGPP
ncbi:MAG: hypothetical protein JKY09_00765 [Crocinitomicaceae bacterium]|nr:hypothetical protein [Crocinitomicaceae bacterium]